MIKIDSAVVCSKAEHELREKHRANPLLVKVYLCDWQWDLLGFEEIFTAAIGLGYLPMRYS